MKKAEPTDNEAERLSSLKQLNILDTPTEDRFDRITRLAQRSVGTPIALVSLIDVDRQWYKSSQGLSGTQTHRDISFCGHAIHSDEVFVVSDALTDERFADNPLVKGEPQIRFYAGKPIHAPDGQRIGTLCVIDRVPREFSDAERETLEDLGKLVEAELKLTALSASEKMLRAQLSEAERRAAIDGLTRLWNHESIIHLIENQLARSRRDEEPFAVMMVDLDHFKSINDTYGHLGGDRVLQQTAMQMRTALRDYDSIGRYGGEEFAVLLPRTPVGAATDVAKRISQRISHLRVSDLPDHFGVTASIGICCYNKEAVHLGTATDMLVAADRAMYTAKAAGRNCIRVAAE